MNFGFGVVRAGTEPFRHWVVDNFYDPQIAKQLAFDFPAVTDEWYKYENHFETKRATDKLELMTSLHVSTLLMGNSYLFLNQIEKLTGISGLIPDPQFRGGGLHQIMKGGKLDIHSDFNWHKHLKLKRKLNVLLYLNPGYEPHYGGELELWNKDMSECVTKIAPLFNRLVIFETDSESYHGHPNPWQGTTPRKSLAWYFYVSTAEQPDDIHSTKFQKLPDEDTTPEIEALRAKRNEGRL